MKTTLQLLVICFLLSSCFGPNQQQKMDSFVKDCKNKQHQIIATNYSEYYVIYCDGRSFRFNNLKDPEVVLLQADSPIRVKNFHIEFKNGENPDIVENISEKRFNRAFFVHRNSSDSLGVDQYDFSYKNNQIELIDSHLLSFKHRQLIFGNDVTTSYLMNINKPGVILVNNNEGFSQCATIYAGHIANQCTDDILGDPFFDYCFGYNMDEGGYFRWNYVINPIDFTIQERGASIEYVNELYNKLIKYPTSNFTSKQQVRNILSALNDTVHIAQKREAIANLDKESLTLEFLSKAFRNNVKASREYLNKTLVVKCVLEALDHDEDGFFYRSNYKYKLASYAAKIFGSYVCDYDVVALSNDENFVNLEFPREVIMQATLVSASTTKFSFKDCQLIAY